MTAAGVRRVAVVSTGGIGGDDVETVGQEM